MFSHIFVFPKISPDQLLSTKKPAPSLALDQSQAKDNKQNTQTVLFNKLELKIDFNELKKTIQSIAHEAIRNILNDMCDDFEEKVKEFNQDLYSAFTSPETLRENLGELINLITNTHTEISHKGGDKTSTRRANDVLQHLQEQLTKTTKQPMLSTATQLSAESKGSTSQYYWQENRLRLEQQLLLDNSDFTNRFNQTLKAIRDKGRRNQSLPNNVFICYAWPDEKDETQKHLSWVQDFLIGLREHLQLAGISSVRLDIRDNPPGVSIYEYMEKARTADFVLLIGTESLLKKHHLGTSAVCTELIKINQKREDDRKANKFRVFPLLISGDYRESFPAHYELYTTVKDWKGTKTYFQHFQWLTAALYSTHEPAFAEIWNKFLLESSADEKLILNEGIDEKSVLEKLKIEQTEAEKKKAQQAQASRRMLKLEHISTHRIKEQKYISPLEGNHVANVDDYEGFYKLIAQGNINEVDKELNKNPNLKNQCTIEQETPLHVSIKFGHDELTKMLVKKYKPNIEALAKDERTPLHYAARWKKPSIVPFLLINHANPNHPNKYGRIPLHCFAKNNDKASVQSCLTKSDNVNHRGKNGVTPLHWACSNNGIDVVKYLINDVANCNVCAADNNNHTPLFEAVLSGNLDIVKFLVENGAESCIEQEDNLGIGRSPLSIAEVNFKEIYDYLKSKLDKPFLNSLQQNKGSNMFSSNLAASSEQKTTGVITDHKSGLQQGTYKIRGKTIKNILVIGLGPINAAHVIPALINNKLRVFLWSEHSSESVIQIRVKSEESIQSYSVPVVKSPEKLSDVPDLVIWGNKKNTNNEKIQLFKKAFPKQDIPHLVLQNGIGNETDFETLGFNVSRGVLFVGAKKEVDSAGIYYHMTADKGTTVGASSNSSRETSADLIKFLQNLNFKITPCESILIEEIRKTGNNINNYIVIYGKCTVYGDIDKPENSHLKEMRNKAIKEYYAIYNHELSSHGITYNFFLEQVCKYSVDLKHHVPTHAAKAKTLNLESNDVEEMEDLLGKVINDGNARHSDVKYLSEINKAYLEHQAAVKLKPLRFIELIQAEKQSGWNCFDLAIGLSKALNIDEKDANKCAQNTRNKLIAFALDQKNIPEFRHLLAPEIRHAAGLTAVYLNLQEDKEKIDKERNTRLAELFGVAEALTKARTNEASTQAEVAQQIAKLLVVDDRSKNDADKINLDGHTLPKSLQTEALRTLVNNYQSADEKIQSAIKELCRQYPQMIEAVTTCKQALSQAQNNRVITIVSAEELYQYLQTPERQKQYPIAWEAYHKQYQTSFSPHEQALQTYYEDEKTYCTYINDYYGKQGWIAFQRSFKAENTSTSMVDIAARLINAQIVVCQKHPTAPNTWEEIYCTAASAVQNNKKVYVQFNGYDHFIALQENPAYAQNLASHLQYLGIFNITSDVGIMDDIASTSLPLTTAKARVENTSNIATLITSSFLFHSPVVSHTATATSDKNSTTTSANQLPSLC